MSESIKVYSRPVDVVNILLSKSLEQQHTFMGELKTSLTAMLPIMIVRLAMGEDIKFAA